jgi:hypothetical protein
MEMRKETIENLGQEVVIKKWQDFEEDFLENCLEIKLVDEFKNESYITPQDIKNNLNVNEVEELYYIENQNAVRILFINGISHVLYRV